MPDNWLGIKCFYVIYSKSTRKINSNISGLNSNVGNLSSLYTSVKTDMVSALNEVRTFTPYIKSVYIGASAKCKIKFGDVKGSCLVWSQGNGSATLGICTSQSYFGIGAYTPAYEYEASYKMILTMRSWSIVIILSDSNNVEIEAL